MADSVTLAPADASERIRKMVREYLDTMEDGRSQSELCRDYYDGKQWTAEEIAALKLRGQPPIVFNRVKRKIDSILGVERRQRTDPKAYPRTPKDEQSADTATQALRFVADETRLNNIFSGAFETSLHASQNFVSSDERPVSPGSANASSTWSSPLLVAS